MCESHVCFLTSSSLEARGFRTRECPARRRGRTRLRTCCKCEEQVWAGVSDGIFSPPFSHLALLRENDYGNRQSDEARPWEMDARRKAWRRRRERKVGLNDQHPALSRASPPDCRDSRRTGRWRKGESNRTRHEHWHGVAAGTKTGDDGEKETEQNIGKEKRPERLTPGDETFGPIWRPRI